MFKRTVLLFAGVFVLMSCYPMGTFQGPEVLPQGKESIGIGVSWMTNIISIDDSSSGNENASFSDASLLFRRGFANNTELGFKFMKGSDIGLAVMTDVKWLVIQSPINLAVDLGMSVWRIGGAGWVGYHPSILAGTENFFAVAQYNYIRSPGNVTRTQDILVGKHFKQKDTRYTLTPFIGLHRNEAALENVYYSLGFGFRQPLDKWTFPR